MHPNLYLQNVENCVFDFLKFVKQNDANSIKKEFFNTKKSQKIPLVVNTIGWVKGLGLDLVRAIIRITDGKNVLHLDLNHIANFRT